jgi:endonuclease YncB( thermonuclease family)
METPLQILPTLLAAAVAAIQTSSVPPKIHRSDPVLVTRVIDGDTIDVSTVGRVRLLGIDAPEVGHGFDTAAPFGREARDRLISMVLHRWVRLEREGPAVDSYNRHLAYVMREDGVFVNAALVRDGLARVTARLPLARLDELKGAEAEAQRARRGMWGSVPRIPAPGYTRPSGAKRSPASKSKTSKPTSAAKKKKKKKTTKT